MAQKQAAPRIIFTKEMKKTHTLLMPGMLPIHFEMLKNIFSDAGYKAELLSNKGPQIIQTGLQYVHNDTCYPALLVIGQLIDALQSGQYDLDHVALMITQTGGGCRASNYIHLLRKALKKAGLEKIPVISLNLSGMEPNPGFRLSIPLMRMLIAALVYGDALMHVSNQVRPYERYPGDTNRLIGVWIERFSREILRHKGYVMRNMRTLLHEAVQAFGRIEVNEGQKIKVGVVGEIYIKYASLGNNDLEAFLQSQNCEYCVPGVMGFALFKTDNRLEDIKLYGGNPLKYAVVSILLQYLTHMEDTMIHAFAGSRFLPPGAYAHTKKLVRGIIGYGSKMGEGWLLTAEMMELTQQGYENIICAQPFGCLPNHINGRGMINKIKQVLPNANIVAIDYDPGAARVNQENRIKLMLATAREAMEQRDTAIERYAQLELMPEHQHEPAAIQPMEADEAASMP